MQVQSDLGACLLQEEKPVYFASKTLMETQRGYVVVELESLAVAWAVRKVPSLPIWIPLHA